MRILALDLSSKTGWAVDKPSGGDDPLFGTVELPGDFGDRYYGLFKFILDAIEVHQVDALIFEAPMPTGPKQNTTFETVRQQFGLAAIPDLIGKMRSIDCYEETPQTVRKLFTGSGANDREAKARVTMACGILGWKVRTTDEADACALWAYCKANTDPQFAASLKARLAE